MCMKKGVPARPARGLCNERHGTLNWTITSATTTSATTTSANTYWTTTTANDTGTTGGFRWASPTNRVTTLL
ncbi:hypothetical protein LCGC14_0676740 [marine sediment metagenome]|uniref:Uncharacterized protein n=1 Tax=marine sediment metagenome TaxID=412755 RepID=A0A0F9QPC8_9ZZZZ